MLRDASPEVDACADEHSVAALPAVRLDIINPDAQRHCRAWLCTYGYSREQEKKEPAESSACHTKAIRKVAKINAAEEFHMTEIAPFDDGFAAPCVSHA